MTIALGFPLGFARARRAAASIGVVLALGAVLSTAIGTAAAQNAAAKRAPAQGAGSTQAIAAQMKNAIALTRGGKFDAGYAQLLAALDAADKLDDAQFVMEQYFDATTTLRAVKRDDLAEKLFVRAFQSKAAAQRPPGNADVLLMYAILLSDHARIAEAVPLYMKAIAAFNAYWGEGSEESLIASDKLAVALSANGSAASATNLGRHNFERAEKALGPDHRTTWKLANNYADMLREIGAPAKALELDLFAIEKRARHYGENHLNTLVTVNNAGQDFLNLGRFDDARRYFRRHRAIAAAMAPKDPSFAGQADAWLFYTDMLAAGDAAIAPADLGRLEAIVANEANYADFLRIKSAVLAAGQRAQRRERDKGMRLRETALAISTRAFTAQHPISFEIKLGIATALIADDPSRAVQAFAALDREMFDWMRREVGTSGDRAVAEAIRAHADHLLFAFGRFATGAGSAVAQPAFAAAVLHWKTLGGADATALRQLETEVAGKDEETATLLRTALRLNGEKQELFSSGNIDDWARSVWGRQDAAEKALQKRLDAIGMKLPQDPIRPSQLLAAREAVVNYFITRQWKADRQAKDPLAATVLYAIVETATSEPRVVDLGDPGRMVDTGVRTEIARLRATRAAAPDPDTHAPDVKGRFQNLRARLFAPLEPLLKDKTTLYVVPDGFLFAVPFALLPGSGGGLLEDKFTIRMLTSPDALIAIHARETLDQRGTMLLAGGIEYGEPGPMPLPATRTEIEAIAKLARARGAPVEMLTGRGVSEGTLRAAIGKARIAHLATHGFYRDSTASGLDTLWQSGIVLSGAGDSRFPLRDENDGYLYGFELMDWDLSGLDLLVLSACETGRGDESFVSGLRGLPTALGIAGARRALLTLWPVADQGTANFTVRFYEHLAEGLTYSDALRQTRRDARDDKVAGAGDASVWAAFVLFEG
ncbi:CHAT domain-containing protein [Bradyrhizobium sp. USDA 4532]|uniref:CHAT domain-containing protein n=1 Tax=unclassified Bradyrhizobium TaxID=2631580 RepID=UPI00209FF2BA|nr:MULTISPECIES: CHAT domain-containing tetratricopeptide repeat protein [unclassified Bradyrhizobium]MCP1835938.1 CHAT domain-containing protein [Bradyrhizobium sp. USDA 4545]MCP1920687.1 CHAT domain-containing protein [Bradyrhizobium sp. USDA 4532]